MSRLEAMASAVGSGVISLGLAAVFTFLSSCGKNGAENGGAAYVVLSTAAMTVPAEGGDYSFTYDIPSEGMTVTCTADVPWISVLGYSDGTATFSVAPNSESTRTAVVTVTCSSSVCTATGSLTVAQYAAVSPVLNVSPVAVTVPVGGGVCECLCLVENPSEDGEVSCVSDTDWISGIEVFSDGTVIFTAEANPTFELREGKVTIEYKCYAGIITAEVAVVQDRAIGSEVDLSSIAGTYSASGVSYYNGTTANEKWTMTLIADPDDGSILWIDGITPGNEGYSKWGTTYLAYCNVSDDLGTITVQLPYVSLGKAIVSEVGTCYYGYVVNTANATSDMEAVLTFTYDSEAGTWTSDYGVMIGAFSEHDISSFLGYTESIRPSITLKKSNTSTSAMSIEWDSAVSEENLPSLRRFGRADNVKPSRD